MLSAKPRDVAVGIAEGLLVYKVRCARVCVYPTGRLSCSRLFSETFLFSLPRSLPHIVDRSSHP